MSLGSRVRRSWNRARSEPDLGRNLIVIAVLFAIGSTVGGYFLANQRFNPPWEDRYSVYAMFEESPAVSPGNGQEVRIAGVDVGDIRSADVSDSGKARVEMRIDTEHTVHDNATPVLRSKSPLNEMYIELDPGGPPGEPLEDGDTLPAENSERPVQVDEVLADLDDNARMAATTLLSEADVALANAPEKLPAGLRGLEGVVRQLEPVMAQLETRRELLSRLVTAISRISTATGEDDERLSRLASSLETTLGTVADSDGELDASLAQLPELSDDLRAATEGVTELAGELDPALDGVREASEELPDALARTDDSIAELDGFVDAAEPVLDKASPVVSDLRPAVDDLNHSLDDLKPITEELDPITSGLVPYLTDLQAFVHNTNSVASLSDVNRGILRGQVNVTTQSIPALRNSDTEQSSE
ncbi:phospholipid/cholesterol/gamma-HCH transport system substrate-binding protein [Haloechinothrix alba]|uniref:Phospholipid/cholesterol/gamma-HCH transport system substrate-binding protein n=1 Tax=Haloechinothrix alba TaxID=664784 RepID=A0A238ZL23_9PSEU|nr:MlaD family protein [Haloechinothrix alba]SNR84136.1 phospholipid/cholesterol/gamma-HCH transport system substrate-binding protein [Haloechinothrix alba]